MDKSKLLKTLISFYKKLEIESPTADDKFFVQNIHLFLAQAILYDFRGETSKQLANVILASIEI